MSSSDTGKDNRRQWIDLDNLKDLIELVKGSEISELEVEKDGLRVKIKKPASSTSSISRRIERTVSAILPSITSKQESAPSIPEEVEGRFHMIYSPIVGTFYRSPSPGAEPYVNVGDIVKKGQILCIIEAMKLMNEIEAEIDGKVVDIMVEDAQPVEYGEPLFKIEPL